MRRNRLLGAGLGAILLLILIFTGCGKKGDPLPPQVLLPAAIVDLSAASLPEEVLLRWSLPDSIDGSFAFKILRSGTVAGDACPGCPQKYLTLGTLAPADRRLGREGERGFRYIDTAVRTGHFYSYRVAVCDPAGHCGEASNEAGLIHNSR
ncbi:MAG: hypothetical protein AABZ85_09300 [Thermodesulfobacteriota bacterium]